MNDWHKLCITDKSGKEMFKCTASPMATMSEIRNLKRHIEQAKKAPHMYKGMDVDSMVLMMDGVPYNDPSMDDISDDDLLNELLG